MFKYFIYFISFAISLYANDNYAMIFDVNKGGKKLGSYEISQIDNSIKAVSSGVSNRVKFCVDKEISFKEDGYKRVIFKRNKKVESFDVNTKLSSIDTKRKEFWQVFF